MLSRSRVIVRGAVPALYNFTYDLIRMMSNTFTTILDGLSAKKSHLPLGVAGVASALLVSAAIFPSGSPPLATETMVSAAAPEVGYWVVDHPLCEDCGRVEFCLGPCFDPGSDDCCPAEDEGWFRGSCE